MSAADSPRPGASAARIRRRRLGAAAVGALLVAIGAIVAVLANGSGSVAPGYSPAGGRQLAIPSPDALAGLTVRGGPQWHPPAAAVRRAAAMPLAQKIAQLFVVALAGNSPTSTAAQLAGADWGGVLLDRSNYVSSSQLTEMTAAVRGALGGAGLPQPLVSAAQDGGPHSAFPGLPPRGEAALGAAGDPAAARTQATAAATALRALGVTMTLAPVADVDIATGAFSGTLFSSNPATVARFVTAADGGYRQAGLIDAVGHFPGEGGASADPEVSTATVGGSLAELEHTDLAPFSAVAARAPVIVMSNAVYAAFDGVTPASLLPGAVSLLRDGFHFQGVVMSGDLDAAIQPTGSDVGSLAVRALRAGDDLLMLSGSAGERQSAYAAVLAAARRSASLRDAIGRALVRVLTLKSHYGLLG